MKFFQNHVETVVYSMFSKLLAIQVVFSSFSKLLGLETAVYSMF